MCWPELVFDSRLSDLQLSTSSAPIVFDTFTPWDQSKNGPDVAVIEDFESENRAQSLWSHRRLPRAWDHSKGNLSCQRLSLQQLSGSILQIPSFEHRWTLSLHSYSFSGHFEANIDQCSFGLKSHLTGEAVFSLYCKERLYPLRKHSWKGIANLSVTVR